MKKLIAVGAGAVGAGALSVLVFGSGTAAADDYAGQTYGDAASAAGDAGQTVVIASRVGGVLSDDKCIVERSQSAPFLNSQDFSHVTNTVQFYLNCNGEFATATTPGTSVGSQEGRQAKAAADEKKAEEEAKARQQQELAEVSTPDE